MFFSVCLFFFQIFKSFFLCISYVIPAYLSHGFHPFEQYKEQQGEHQHQAQDKLPAGGAQVGQTATVRKAKDAAPAQTEPTSHVFVKSSVRKDSIYMSFFNITLVRIVIHSDLATCACGFRLIAIPAIYFTILTVKH